MNPKECVNADKPLENNAGALYVVLPGYRGPFAANDFIDSEARDTDEDIASYLARHTSRAPWGFPKQLVFQLATENKDTHKEQTTAEAYRDLFRYHACIHWRQFTDQWPMTIALASLGVFMLWLSDFLDDTNLSENLRSTLSNTIQVGAWVATWTAIAGIFSAGFLSLQKYLAFRRLMRADMRFLYSTAGTQFEDSGKQIKQPAHHPSSSLPSPGASTTSA